MPITVPPSNQRRKGIKNSAPTEYASDSINSEDALGERAGAASTRPSGSKGPARPGVGNGTFTRARFGRTSDSFVNDALVNDRFVIFVYDAISSSEIAA
jgi:hypothetical protein